MTARGFEVTEIVVRYKITESAYRVDLPGDGPTIAPDEASVIVRGASAVRVELRGPRVIGGGFVVPRAQAEFSPDATNVPGLVVRLANDAVRHIHGGPR